MPESPRNELKGPTFRRRTTTGRPPSITLVPCERGLRVSRNPPRFESKFGGISLVGSVRKLVPLCSSLKALSFSCRSPHQIEPGTTKNDRQTVAIEATSPPVGRPSPPAGTSTSGSIEPVCRPFCTEFAAENACYAFFTFCRCLCKKIRPFRCRNRPGRGSGSPARPRSTRPPQPLPLFVVVGSPAAAALSIAAANDPSLPVLGLNVRVFE